MLTATLNSGETIGVRLGNAANNDGTSQSLVDAGDGSDLQTIDDSTPAPANGESETSVLQEATVEASPTALAKVLKPKLTTIRAILSILSTMFLPMILVCRLNLVIQQV